MKAQQQQHTPEPWERTCEGLVYGLPNEDGESVFVCDTLERDYSTTPNMIANANRIVACVNGCKGIHDPETTVPELLAALIKLDEAMRRHQNDPELNENWDNILGEAEEVLARAEEVMTDANAHAEVRLWKAAPELLDIAKAEGRAE